MGGCKDQSDFKPLIPEDIVMTKIKDPELGYQKTDPGKCDEERTPSQLKLFMSETKTIVQLFIPIVVSNILLYVVTLVSSMMTGRLSKAEFDATALSLSFITTYGTSPVTGACTSCDTLFSQSTGSANKKRTGVWLQKGLLVLNVGTLFLAAIHANIEPIYILMGQDPVVARLAGKFGVLLVPGLIFYTNFLVLLRFLQNIGCTYAPTFILVITNIINVIIQYVALFVFDAGYLASAVSMSITYGLSFLLELLYLVVFKKYEGFWDGFQREALTEWAEFTKLSMCGVGHYAFESIALNIGIIVSGTINATLMAAQSILHQFETLLYMIPGAVSVSINIRVGQTLGSGNYKNALLCMKTSFILMAFFVLSLAIVILSAGSEIPWIFTNHAEIVQQVVIVLPIMIAVIGMDCFRGIVDGAMRGCGRQLIGAVLNFVSGYCVGLPIAVPLLLLTPLRLTGFWLGIFFSLIISFILATACLVKQNWETEAVKAQMRILCKSNNFVKKGKASEKTPLLSVPVASKIRTPREPRSCSTNFEVMKEHPKVPDDEFRALILKRSLISAGFVLFFLCSLISNFAIPHDIYNPLSFNSSIVEAPGLGNSSFDQFQVPPA